MESHTTDNKEWTYQCRQDDTPMSPKDDLQSQMDNFIEEKSGEYTECGRSVPSKNEVQVPVNDTDRGESHPESLVSGKLLSSKSPIRTSLRIQIRNRPYSCEMCENSFAQKTRQLDYCKDNTGIKLHQHEKCDNKFTQKSPRKHSRNIYSQCDWCDESSTPIIHVTPHDRIHTGKRLYQCDQCDKTFMQIGSLNCHKKMHAEENTFQCDQCYKSFRVKASLMQHLKIHTEEGQRLLAQSNITYICKGSPKKNHMNSKRRESLYQCHHCDFAFQHLNELTLHEQIHNQVVDVKSEYKDDTEYETVGSVDPANNTFQATRYQCRVCKKYLASSNSLADHTRTHSGEKPYECIICSKTFTQRSNLRRHEMAHAGVRKFPCRYCDREFGQKVNMLLHEETHKHDIALQFSKPAVDEKSEFVDEANLSVDTFDENCPEKNQMESRRGERFYHCQHCHSAFQHLHELKHHEQLHNQVVDVKSECKDDAEYETVESMDPVNDTIKPTRYQCRVCKKYLASSNSLVDHMRTHSGEKPYTCNICSKTFTQKSNLRRHEMVHIGLKKFACRYCDRKFGQKVNMQVHEETHKQDVSLQFNYLAVHENLEFQDKANVDEKSEIENEATVLKSEFENEATVLKSEFENEANVEKSDFENESTVEKSKFENETTVEKSNFENEAYMIVESAESIPSQKYECGICNRTLASSTSLIDHLRTHSGEKPYNCKICSKTFTQRSNLRRHEMVHIGVKKFACRYCGRKFGQKVNMKVHEETHKHDVALQFNNSAVDNRSEFEDESNKNMGSSKILPSRKYKSRIYRKKFFDSKSFFNHLKALSDKRPYKCSMCAKTFTQKSSLTQHEMTHSILKRFACQYCDRTFRQKMSVKVHEKKHKHAIAVQLHNQAEFEGETYNSVDSTNAIPSTKYQCNVCKRFLASSNSLVDHMRTHSGEKPYECRICSKTFTQKSNLRRHEMAHVGLKKYSCQYCHRRFGQKVNMKVHEETHKNVTTLQCLICGEQFNNARALSDHYVVHTHTGHDFGSGFEQYPSDEIKTEKEDENEQLNGIRIKAENSHDDQILREIKVEIVSDNEN